MSKSNEVYNFIVDRLVNAHYGFGDRLLVKELSAETGASRQPIMSALNRLSVEGFVTIIPQVGCEVISPSRDEIADFFQLFQLIEGLLADLAAKRRTEEDIQRLEAAQRQIQGLSETKKPSVKEFVRINREFHRALHLMAHSPLLDRKQRNNFNMADFFITNSVGFKALISDAAREHDRIIDAVVQQDSNRARLEAESHFASIASAVIASLEADAEKKLAQAG